MLRMSFRNKDNRVTRWRSGVNRLHLGAGVAEVAVALGQHWRWWQWRLAAAVFQRQPAAVIIHACHLGAGDTAAQNCDEIS